MSVQCERVVMHARENDGEPHYGAANLENLTIGAECTSGFVVKRQGILGAVTAGKGHCFGALGEAIYSGVEYYGESGALAAEICSLSAAQR